MAVVNMTSNTTSQVSGPAQEVLVTINNGWTGTIVLIDNTSGSTPLVGTITNPATGNVFRYINAFKSGVRVTTTGTLGDVTISTIGARGKN